MKSAFILIITYCIVLFGCNNKSDTASTETTKVDSATKPKDKFSVDDLYTELMARSQYSSEKDSLLAVKKNDTSKPNFRIDALAQITNSDLLDLYKTELQERKVIYGIDNRADVIYGFDNNDDLQHASDSNYITSARCVAGLVPKALLDKNRDGTFRLRGLKNYAEAYQLCSGERFQGQPVIADCTAFGISPGIMATAGHCLDKNNFSNYVFIFDLTLYNTAKFQSDKIPDSLIYNITDVVCNPHKNDTDFAIVKVDKRIPDSRIARINPNNNLTSDTKFYVLGYPCGLPLKICNESILRSNANSFYFVINSDTYGGNSGSPIFNSSTNEVEGILVRGNIDFKIPTGANCNQSITCPERGCRGEDATRIQLLLKYFNF